MSWSFEHSWLGPSWSGTYEYFVPQQTYFETWEQPQRQPELDSWWQPPWESQCSLKQELKRLADRRNQTINEVRRAREKVH